MANLITIFTTSFFLFSLLTCYNFFMIFISTGKTLSNRYDCRLEYICQTALIICKIMSNRYDLQIRYHLGICRLLFIFKYWKFILGFICIAGIYSLPVGVYLPIQKK